MTRRNVTGRTVRVLVRLKWDLLRGGFRGRLQQRLATSLSLVFSVAAGLFALAIFVSIGRGFAVGDEMIVVALPVIVVSVGLLSAAAGVEATIDVRNLATEPLRPSELSAGLLAAALVGPAALLGALSGLGLAIGWWVGGPGAAIVVVGATVLWWATLLLVSRTGANALGVLAVGRFRQIAQTLAALSGIALWFVFQFSARAMSGWDRAQWERVASIAALTPPGQIGRALGAADRPATAALHLLLAASWLPLLWWLHTVTLGRLVGAPPRAGAEPRTVRTGRSGLRAGVLRVLPAGPAGAIAARTMRTKVRTPREAVNTIVALVVGVGALVLAPLVNGGSVGERIVLSAGLLHFAVLFEGNNTFGFDGPPLWMEVGAGADGRTLARGKALASVTTMALPALALVLALAAVSGGWRWVPAGAVLALGSVLVAAGASVVSASVAPFALPDSPNPFAAGDTGQGCLAGGALAATMVVLTILSLPVALAVWWAADRGPGMTAAVSLLAPIGGAFVLWAGIRLAGRAIEGREAELVARVSPAR
ncbi:MAG: hypothetical protein ACOYOP_12980 [Microthrixaceae bacterium]